MRPSPEKPTRVTDASPAPAVGVSSVMGISVFFCRCPRPGWLSRSLRGRGESIRGSKRVLMGVGAPLTIGARPPARRSSSGSTDGATSRHTSPPDSKSSTARPKSASKVCASVPISSFSRSASERRSTATGASCSPTTTTRPPGRTRSVASCTRAGTPVHSKTTVGAAPASRSTSGVRRCAATVLCAPRAPATASRSTSRSMPVTSAPSRAAACTTKAPIPPVPTTTACSPEPSRPRATAWAAMDMGCAMAATSGASARPRRLTQADAGTVVNSARAPLRCRPTVE